MIIAADGTGSEIVESWTKTRRSPLLVPGKWILMLGVQCTSVITQTWTIVGKRWPVADASVGNGKQAALTLNLNVSISDL